jgi:hypothetical protein
MADTALRLPGVVAVAASTQPDWFGRSFKSDPLQSD